MPACAALSCSCSAASGILHSCSGLCCVAPCCIVIISIVLHLSYMTM